MVCCCVRQDWHTHTGSFCKSLLCCHFVPVWSLASYTQSCIKSNVSAWPHSLHSLALLFLQSRCLLAASYRNYVYNFESREADVTLPSRVDAKASCLCWVWLKSGSGNPLLRLLHAEMVIVPATSMLMNTLVLIFWMCTINWIDSHNDKITNRLKSV